MEITEIELKKALEFYILKKKSIQKNQTNTLNKSDSFIFNQDSDSLSLSESKIIDLERKYIIEKSLLFTLYELNKRTVIIIEFKKLNYLVLYKIFKKY